MKLTGFGFFYTICQRREIKTHALAMQLHHLQHELIMP